jgi:DNA helicase IV
MNKIDYIEKEQKVLDSVLMNILRRMAKYKDGINFNKESIKLILEHMQEAGYTDAKSSITQIITTKKSYEDSKQSIDDLEKSLEKPYFGKIELKEKGDIYISETLHVGMIDGDYKIVMWKDRENKSAGIVKIYYSSNVVPKVVSWVEKITRLMIH